MKLLLLLLAPLLLGSCIVQGVRLADGTTVINHGAVSHKSDDVDDTSDITLPNGIHIVQHHQSKKPDGTEWTKIPMYDMTKSLAKYAAHSKDIQTRGDTAVKLKGTKDPNVIPADPNVIPADPNVIPK